MTMLATTSVAMCEPGPTTLSREEVSVSGLAYSARRAELLVSYQGDQIYGFRTDAAAEGEDGVVPEAWSLGGHFNSQTFLKSVAYWGPNEEYVVSGCDSGCTWVWDRRTGALAAHPLTDAAIANGAVPHPWAPTLACFGIDKEVKILEAGGGRFTSCFHRPAERPEMYIDDDAEKSPPRGRFDLKPPLFVEQRLLRSMLEKQMQPAKSTPPRFVHDPNRYLRHVARMRRGLDEETRLALALPSGKPVYEPEMDAETRRLLLLLPDCPVDVEGAGGSRAISMRS